MDTREKGRGSTFCYSTDMLPNGRALQLRKYEAWLSKKIAILGERILGFECSNEIYIGFSIAFIYNYSLFKRCLHSATTFIWACKLKIKYCSRGVTRESELLRCPI